MHSEIVYIDTFHGPRSILRLQQRIGVERAQPRSSERSHVAAPAAAAWQAR